MSYPIKNRNAIRFARMLLGGAAVVAAMSLIPAASAQDRDRDANRLTRIEPGTNLAVRTTEAIDVDRRDNRVFRGVVERDVRGENGRLAIPRGAPVDLVVRVAPDNDLIIDIGSVMVDGQRYAVRTDTNRIESDRDNSLVGAIVGAVSGAEVRGRAVHIHPNTVLNFRIDRPMEMAAADRGGYQDRGAGYGQAPVPGQGEGRRYTRIEPGTNLSVRTTEAIDVDRRDDRVFHGVVDQEVRGENGRVAIPRGAPVDLIVRVAPDKDLIIDVDSVMVDGQRFAVRTDTNRVESQRDNSLIGAIVGAVSGEEVRGRAVHIHPNAVLNFRIDRPMEMGVTDRGRDRDHPNPTEKKQ
jgi:hypothetical protein